MAHALRQLRANDDVRRISAADASPVALLASTLRTRWSAATSVDEKAWSADNPAWGQCAVTSLVVQDRFGGCLLRARFNGTTHYWNRLPSGEEVDLTREQFGAVADFPEGEERDRDYVLSFPDTARRYRLLVESVQGQVVSR